MNIILLSKDGHIRTLINKCSSKRCIMISSMTQINNKLIDFVDLFIIDEFFFSVKIISHILLEYPKANIIFLMKGKRGYIEKCGKIIFYYKPILYDTFFSLINDYDNSLNNDLIQYEDDLLIGSSLCMERVRKELLLLSKQDCPVLLFGESGTGKELAAKVIHNNSKYKNNKPVVVNCSLLNSELSDSLLFGHKKGAYTGAEDETSGLIERANNNTFFLDEIENISIDSQSKLLRVLDLGEYRKLGDPEVSTSFFRLISASNKDINALINKNKFRKDFYYRISLIQVRLPSLDEHKQDIEELVNYYFKVNNETRSFEKDFLKKLSQMSWPGNVRQLNSVLEKSRIYSSSSCIRLKL